MSDLFCLRLQHLAGNSRVILGSGFQSGNDFHPEFHHEVVLEEEDDEEFLDPSSPFFLASFSDPLNSDSNSDSDSGSRFRPHPLDPFRASSCRDHAGDDGGGGGRVRHVADVDEHDDLLDHFSSLHALDLFHPSPIPEVDEPDWGPPDEFFRSSAAEGSGSGGLNVVEFDCESDPQEEIDGVDYTGLSALYWESLHLEEGDDVSTPMDCNTNHNHSDDFEWEEVDDRIDDREVLSIDIRDNELEVEEEIETEAGVAQNVDWEVLAVRNLTRNPLVSGHEDAESFAADEEHDHEDYGYTNEYEVLFGQFIEHNSVINGPPPAAKLVVEGLPTVFLTEDDLAKNNTLCAVCKDEISLEEGAKRLPCTHHYHADCILPWLGIRNTCPVCRHELPTDDAEYENWKARRTGADTGEESGARYGFEIVA